MGKLVPVATGADLWVEVAGDGPPVVLIHGNLLSTAMWEPQVPALSESFTVIAYDVRGFGRSPYRPGRHWDRADLKALVDELAVERPNLCFGRQVLSVGQLGHAAAHTPQGLEVSVEQRGKETVSRSVGIERWTRARHRRFHLSPSVQLLTIRSGGPRRPARARLAGST